MDWYGFKPYVPVAQQRARAQKEIAALAKTQPLSPVTITGKKIATTWWGKSWCANLERYADYSNRIGRGSAYVKNGFVIDLSIEAGRISAKEMGAELDQRELE